ncbi:MULTISPECIES: MlaD family protein [Roseomonadaceae]|uniref:MCE family protein n=1 Tax=Falsiroseomonas oleicola TaxID=2801474 RepID=A0ABS6H3J9_9PROT|nr:MlaD family protein [Roseomonas oleicola]MBU8543242.1 MCE family protein [Roseomonas oleicola]
MSGNAVTHEDRVRLRHTDRWVGALVLLALLLFLGALAQRGVLRDWFDDGSTLMVLLPEEGVAGLSVGADAEVLGIRAGSVRRIIVDPERRIRAELRIEEQAKPFIRRDSTAVVRRRFGVAGPAYLDIQRGRGEELNWDRAWIRATSERAPTETLGTLLDELQERVFPVLEELRTGTAAFAAATQRLERGEGTIGRLLNDDTLIREAEAATARAAQVMANIEGASVELRQLTAGLRGADGRGGPGTLPGLVARAERVLAQAERATADIARASPALPQITANVRDGTDGLPAVMVQAQEAARQMELLLLQLRRHWLLGSGGGEVTRPVGTVARPAVERLRP